MVEAHFVERRRRRERRDVAADALVGLVGAHDHRRRVPADQALDAALEIGLPGISVCSSAEIVLMYGVLRGERQLDAVLRSREASAREASRADFDRTAALQDIIKGIEPFARFDGIELRSIV